LIILLTVLGAKSKKYTIQPTPTLTTTNNWYYSKIVEYLMDIKAVGWCSKAQVITTRTYKAKSNNSTSTHTLTTLSTTNRQPIVQPTGHFSPPTTPTLTHLLFPQEAIPQKQPSVQNQHHICCLVLTQIRYRRRNMSIYINLIMSAGMGAIRKFIIKKIKYIWIIKIMDNKCIISIKWKIKRISSSTISNRTIISMITNYSN
jgi:hypothetical protein